jgi:hypothetical protein
MLTINEQEEADLFKFISSEMNSENTLTPSKTDDLDLYTQNDKNKVLMISALNSLAISTKKNLTPKRNPNLLLQNIKFFKEDFNRSKENNFRGQSLIEKEIKFNLSLPKQYHSTKKIEIDVDFLKKFESKDLNELKHQKLFLENEILSNYQDCLKNFEAKEYISPKEVTNEVKSLRHIGKKQIKEQYYTQQRKDVKDFEFDINEMMVNDLKPEEICVNNQQIKAFGDNFMDDEEDLSRSEEERSEMMNEIKSPEGQSQRFNEIDHLNQKGYKESVYGESDLKKRIDQFNKITILRENFLENHLKDSANLAKSVEYDDEDTQEEYAEGSIQSNENKNQQTWEETEELMLNTFQEFRISDIQNMYEIPESEGEGVKSNMNSIKKPVQMRNSENYIFDSQRKKFQKNSLDCFQKIEEQMQDTINVLGFDPHVPEIIENSEEDQDNISKNTKSVDSKREESQSEKSTSIKLKSRFSKIFKMDVNENDNNQIFEEDLNKEDEKKLRVTLRDLSEEIKKSNEKMKCSRKNTIDELLRKNSLNMKLFMNEIQSGQQSESEQINSKQEPEEKNLKEIKVDDHN